MIVFDYIKHNNIVLGYVPKTQNIVKTMFRAAILWDLSV